MCPIVVVSCFNQLALLELQAQSISKHLKGKHDIFIIVNELDTTLWDIFFDQNIRHYYSNHSLHVLYAKDFDIEESPKYHTAGRHWAGWDSQQLLKLAIAERINSVGYLVLDCQNYLIKQFSTHDYIVDNQLPIRMAPMSMPEETWNTYCKELGLNLKYPKISLAICTPIFLNTSIVKSLINSKGNVLEFSKWFNRTTKFKSEFMLYDIWRHKISSDCHYIIDTINDWANPYLRDHPEFDLQFDIYLAQLGDHEPHKWTSINYRAWGDMSEDQYTTLKTKLAKFDIVPALDNFRLTYNQT